MKNNLLKIENQNVFFRTKGKGFPIVLFHASPSSSNMLIPLMEKLAKNFLVIAFDTPGYGASRPLNIDFKNISDYCVFYKKCFEKIGLEKFAIYGTATGAQIGIRYALEYPNQVAHLFLDNVAHFTDDQRSDILKSYFPDLTPKLDGSHLKKTWKIISGMFCYFPWFKKTDAYKLDVPFPPTMVLHLIAKDFLTAGKNYDTAYRAAFAHERAEYVQALKVPTTIFNWQGSIISDYLNQLLAFDFPENIQVAEIPVDRVLRMEKMVEVIQENYTDGLEVELLDFPTKKKTELDFSEFPKITPDEKGEYLLTAWNFLVEKKKDADANMIQEELKNWMNSIKNY